MVDQRAAQSAGTHTVNINPRRHAPALRTVLRLPCLQHPARMDLVRKKGDRRAANPVYSPGRDIWRTTAGPWLKPCGIRNLYATTQSTASEGAAPTVCWRYV